MTLAAGGMAQWLSVFVAISRDSGFIPKTNEVVHSHQISVEDIHVFSQVTYFYMYTCDEKTFI